MVSCIPTNGMPKISVDARIKTSCHVWDAPSAVATHSHQAVKNEHPALMHKGFQAFLYLNALCIKCHARHPVNRCLVLETKCEVA